MADPKLVAALTPDVTAFGAFFDLFAEPFEPPTVDDTGRAILDIRGVIGFHADADEMIPALRGLDATTIEVHLDSKGGNVWHGVALANFLRQHSATIEVHVDAMAASAASVIAMAGDTVTMHPGSMMMVHNSLATAIDLRAPELRALVDLLDKVNTNMADMYAARAGGTRAGWLEVMTAESWFTADEAVDAGLADLAVTTTAVTTTAGAGDGDSDGGGSDTQTGPSVSSAAAATPNPATGGLDLTEVFGYQWNGRDNAPAPDLSALERSVTSADAGERGTAGSDIEPVPVLDVAALTGTLPQPPDVLDHRALVAVITPQRKATTT